MMMQPKIKAKLIRLSLFSDALFTPMMIVKLIFLHSFSRDGWPLVLVHQTLVLFENSTFTNWRGF